MEDLKRNILAWEEFNCSIEHLRTINCIFMAGSAPIIREHFYDWLRENKIEFGFISDKFIFFRNQNLIVKEPAWEGHSFILEFTEC